MKAVRFLVPLAAILLLQPAAQADKEKSESSKYLRIPVFYVTDRNKDTEKWKADKPAYGLVRQYVGNCKHDYHMGKAYVTIENVEGKAISPECAALGWQPSNEKSEVYESGQAIEGADHNTVKETFNNQLGQAIPKTPGHELVVFVPGYMSTFDSGLFSAARFGYYSEKPVVLFSWASRGQFKAYGGDEATIEWSQHHFIDFLKQLQAIVAKDPSTKIRCYAHSMGSRLVVRAAPTIRQARCAHEIALVCPDMDDGVVRHYLDEVSHMKAGNKAASVRLYISRKDKMLHLSQRVHAGYARLGEQTDTAPKELKGDVDQAAEDATSDSKGGETEALTAEESDKSEENANLNKTGPAVNLDQVTDRFTTVDFTVMDQGKVGHKIPVRVICNVSRSGVPGEGWKLVHQNAAAGNNETKLVAEDNKVSTEGEPGFFLLVSTLPKTPHKRGTILPRRLKNNDWTLR